MIIKSCRSVREAALKKKNIVCLNAIGCLIEQGARHSMDNLRLTKFAAVSSAACSRRSTKLSQRAQCHQRRRVRVGSLGCWSRYGIVRVSRISLSASKAYSKGTRLKVLRFGLRFALRFSFKQSD